MKDGRDYEKLPEVDPDDFPSRWKVWWTSMQPSWRPLDSSSGRTQQVPAQGREWGILASTGKDGLLLVVASLN